MTISEFDAFVAAQADDRSFELVDGELVMQSNPTESHEQIASNIGAPLKLHMDAKNCRTYIGGMRVQRTDSGDEIDKAKPDVVVRCGPASQRTWITDPLVVVEVLSPSTMDYDRGTKLDFYKSLPTLRHIVIAYQDQMRVEHYRRAEAGWDRETLKLPSDVLYLDACEFRLGLDRIYLGMSP